MAAAFVAAIERPAIDGAIFNVGRGEPVTIMRLAQLVSRALGAEAEPKATGNYRIGDIRHNYADLSCIQASLGLQPRISLDGGLQRFCDWVRGQPVASDRLEAANAELRARGLMG